MMGGALLHAAFSSTAVLSLTQALLGLLLEPQTFI
jgi:hypothetical protein